MKFELKAKADKQIWTNGESYLYGVTDIETEREKRWSIFTKEPLELGATYLVKGTVSESKDKKLKDQNGKDIWVKNFNADSVELLESEVKETPEDFGFNSSGDIPF